MFSRVSMYMYLNLNWDNNKNNNVTEKNNNSRRRRQWQFFGI